MRLNVLLCACLLLTGCDTDWPLEPIPAEKPGQRERSMTAQDYIREATEPGYVEPPEVKRWNEMLDEAGREIKQHMDEQAAQDDPLEHLRIGQHTEWADWRAGIKHYRLIVLDWRGDGNLIIRGVRVNGEYEAPPCDVHPLGNGIMGQWPQALAIGETASAMVYWMGSDTDYHQRPVVVKVVTDRGVKQREWR